MRQEEPVNVLLVDDRRENLIALEAALTSPQHRLVQATSGEEALRLLELEDFAVILLDVQMPTMDGFETARRIRSRERTKSTPIIFVTAISRDEAFARKGYEVGAVDYLFKPLDLDILNAKIGTFTELYRKEKRIQFQAEQIRAAERRERDAFLENALDAVVGINEEGKIIYWNKQAELTFGWTRAEAEGEEVAEMIIPKSRREAHDQGVKRFLETGVGAIMNQRVEVSAVRRDGAEFPVELSISAVRSDGSCSFYAFLRDITERRQAEEEIRKSRDQLGIIFEGVADGILVQDRSFNCVYANEVGARMCGFPNADAFCSASIPELLKQFEISDEEGKPLPPERLPARLALSGMKDPPEAILRVRALPVGRETWSVVSSRPIFDERGVPYLAVSIFRDITVRRLQQEKEQFLAKASEVLSSSLDYNETLQSAARLSVSSLADWCAIDLIEAEGPRSVVVVHPDPKMMKLADELRQKYPPNWNAPTGAPKVLRTGESELYSEISETMLKSAARDEEHLKIILSLGMKSAMVVPIQARGKVLGALTLISTAPARHYTEEELKVAEELGRRAGVAVDNARLYRSAQEAILARDEFLSIASHELKTPLTSLKLQTQMSQRRLEKGDPAFFERKSMGKLLDTTSRQIDRLGKLIEDMLDISRIAHGKLAIEREEVDLGLLVRDVVDRFEEQLKAAGCRYSLYTESAIMGHWDRYRIEQVVINLLTNAMKYGAGRPIEISVRSQEGKAIIVVRDFGMGVAQENLERIFQRFERAITASNISGLGLGLYISRQIVEAHQGRIFVESEFGKGSSFTIELSLAKSL